MISPEEVVEAYRETGLELRTGGCFGLSSKKVIVEACGLGVVVFNRLYGKKTQGVMSLWDLFRAIEEYPRDYRMGFQKGFDGVNVVDFSEEFQKGYKDGEAAYDHCVESILQRIHR